MKENLQKRNEYFQRWQLERQVFSNGMVIVLLLNSVLFLGYVQVRYSYLGVVLSVIGLSSCGICSAYFMGIQRRIGRMETELGFAAEYQAKGRGRRFPLASLILAFIFAPIWVYSLITSSTYVMQ